MLTRLIDRFRRKKILEYAIKYGRDVDGDIVNYKGVTYYVHILEGVAFRL